MASMSTCGTRPKTSAHSDGVDCPALQHAHRLPVLHLEDAIARASRGESRLTQRHELLHDLVFRRFRPSTRRWLDALLALLLGRGLVNFGGSFSAASGLAHRHSRAAAAAGHLNSARQVLYGAKMAADRY